MQRTAEVKCPFFRGHTYTDIGCEGITSNTTIKLSFTSVSGLRAHEKIFCCDHFRNCELYAAIIKQYEE